MGGRSYQPAAFDPFQSQNLVASVESPYTDVETKDRALYLLSYTDIAALNGTLSVQISNDDPKRVQESDFTWTDLDFGTPITISGSGECQLLIKDVTWRNMRLAYTAIAGDGTLTAQLKTATEGV